MPVFVLYGGLKFLAILGSFLLVGFILLPTDITFFLVGALSLCLSLMTLPSNGPAAVWLAGMGAGMIIVGLAVQRFHEREERRQAKELSRNLRRAAGTHVAIEDDD